MANKYIAVTYAVTFFRRRPDGQYVVIHNGLPFTTPKGDISMILLHIDGSQRFVDQLVAGTVYEEEPRPDESGAQSFYDRVMRDRETANLQSIAARTGVAAPVVRQELDQKPEVVG